MKRVAVILIILIHCLYTGINTVSAQTKWRKAIDLSGSWRFIIGDNMKWAEPNMDDSRWERVRVPDSWENQGFHGYNGYAWYRKSFDGRELSSSAGNLTLFLGYVDDIDEVFVNGKKVGRTGSFPPKYSTAYNAKREYYIPDEVINYQGKNTVAVRVYDAQQQGGIVAGDIAMYYNEDEKNLAVNLRGVWDFKLEPRWRIGKEPDERMLAILNPKLSESSGETSWTDIRVPLAWDHQGFSHYDGGAIYRKEFRIPEKFRGETFMLILGVIDDKDFSYLNGKLIGETDGYDKLRVYTITPDMYKIGELNILTIYVEDSTGFGGITDGPVGLVRQVDFTRFIRWR